MSEKETSAGTAWAPIVVPAITALAAVAATLGVQVVTAAVSSAQAERQLELETTKYTASSEKDARKFELELEERYVEKISMRTSDARARESALSYLVLKFKGEPLGEWAKLELDSLRRELDRAENQREEVQRYEAQLRTLRARVASAEVKGAEVKLLQEQIAGLEQQATDARRELVAIKKEVEGSSTASSTALPSLEWTLTDECGPFSKGGEFTMCASEFNRSNPSWQFKSPLPVKPTK